MALIQISNQTNKNLGKKSTIRFTQSICPDCNMILDAEVFERDNQVFMSKICPTHGESRGDAGVGRVQRGDPESKHRE